MKRNILLIFFILIFFTSCKTQKNITKENEVTKLIKQSELPKSVAATDIRSINITGNILTLEVSYSGGCEEHGFKLYFDGNYKKSLPPKANFILVHDNKNDACRELITKTLQFDISPSQYEGQKEIIITVSGSENQVSYKY